MGKALFSDDAGFEAAATALVKEISAIMKEKGAWGACAESLTGGLLASEIVRVPGVSAWFGEGCVTYTDAAKARRLSVSPALLEEYTAVSRPVARAMAEGELAASHAQAAVSTTGLAGPGPDELGREAGLVFIGGATGKGSVTRELHLKGSRLEIRRQAVIEALKLLLGLAKTL